MYEYDSQAHTFCRGRIKVPTPRVQSGPKPGGGGGTDSLGLATDYGICRPPILEF